LSDEREMEAATVFCGDPGRDAAIRVLRDCGAVAATPTDDGEGLELEMAEGQLVARLRSEADNRFDSVILGAHNYFAKIDTPHEQQQERVLDLLERCELMIGFQAAPAMGAADPRWECVLGVAEQLEGMIFDGSSMRDAQGRVILASDGSSDIRN
jgi:hypothetical protein